MSSSFYPSAFLRTTFVLALASILPLCAAEPAPSGPAQQLTLRECIARALDKNFSLKIQGLDSANALEALTVSQSDFDPSFTLSTTKSVNQADQASTTLVGTKSDSLDTRIGVTQKVSSGATVNLSSSLARNSTNNTFATLNPAYNADVSLSISQPLLKNAGSAVNRAAIDKAEIGVTIANLKYKGQVLQLVRDTESAYYNLVFAREQLKVRVSSLELAQKLYEENKTRKNTGVATDLDVLQAEVGVETSRRGVILAQQSVRDAEDGLLNLIGQFEFNTNLGEVSLPAVDNPTPNFGVSLQMARDTQPDYVAATNSLKQLEIDVATAKRNRMPALDLGGAVGYNARDNSAGGALDRLPNGDGYSWQVDLSLKMPWGRRLDKARYQTALNSYQRQQTSVRQMEQNLEVLVRSAVRSVETNLASVAISRKATGLSEKQYELEKARFDAGLSTSRRVLEAQDDLETARVAELQARVNLRTAMAELQRLDGSSLGYYNILVEDQQATVR
ncbi:MAG: TolC family protein [Cephaloticoccus sp.]|nr:TolC family protein [Cephaloticoccus sp.]MCF7759306.1 TolC family protein [Cephaloticoccus sp.]